MWTNRERLYICRYRQYWSQRQAAKFFKVHSVTYSGWERGSSSLPARVIDFVEKFNPVLKTHEVCRLLRRRLGLSIVKAAEAYEISHMTIIKIERGQADPIRYKRWLELAYELQHEENDDE